ncbi:MDR family MFS transporter [Streptomyces sp. CBMA29]|uniref:MDR family MFS transporter n=1 Tax=Streptomyces sp. CBMA29 TaxID=1896314 RepID=UPI001661F588|nr:MDR family MFS transporter [Streptomyces sp. CBMA29]
MTLVATVTILGSLISIFDTTIVQVAVPSLVRSFDTSLATVQWVSTVYLLALATVVPLTGWANDRFGSRRVWIASMAMFLFGSLLCGLANSMALLIAARAVQGIGGGMLLPTGQTILAREAGPGRLGRVMTVVGIPSMLGPLLGPIFGGLILSSLSWRWIFFVNLPLGALGIGLAWVVLDRGEAGVPRKLDLIGLALLPPGLALVVYGISDFGDAGRVSPSVALTGGLGIALIAAFVVHASRAAHPLLDLRLWRHAALRSAQIAMFLYLAATNAVLFLVQLYYQFARGDSAIKAGLLVAPSAFGAMLVLTTAGRVMDKRGPRVVIVFGLLMVTAGVLPLTMIGPDTSDVWLSVCWFVRGVGVGATATPLTAAGYATLRSHEIPGASTLMSIVQYVAGAMGTAVAAVLLQRRLSGFTDGGGVQSLAVLSDTARQRLAPELADAFGGLFWLAVALSVLAIVPAVMLRTRAPTDAERDGTGASKTADTLTG